MTFEIELQPVQQTWADGDRLEVYPVVENTADVQQTHVVSLSIDGDEKDSTPLTLGPGERRDITLAWPDVKTNLNEVVPLTVSAENGDTVSSEITIREYDDEITVIIGDHFEQEYTG